MRMFAARVKGSRLVVIPESSHSAYWEQLEIVTCWTSSPRGSRAQPRHGGLTFVEGGG